MNRAFQILLALPILSGCSRSDHSADVIRGAMTKALDDHWGVPLVSVTDGVVTADSEIYIPDKSFHFHAKRSELGVTVDVSDSLRNGLRGDDSEMSVMSWSFDQGGNAKVTRRPRPEYARYIDQVGQRAKEFRDALARAN